MSETPETNNISDEAREAAERVMAAVEDGPTETNGISDEAREAAERVMAAVEGDVVLSESEWDELVERYRAETDSD